MVPFIKIINPQKIEILHHQLPNKTAMSPYK